MTGRRPFDKPPTTYAQQVDLLEQRGMIVRDRDRAIFYLAHLNYYRLGAYWLPFEADHASHRFRVGTSFDEVVASYMFDRELRLLVLDAIERVEVSIRSHWAYEMAHRHGSHGYLERQLASRTDRFEKNLALLTTEVDRSDEKFIRHLRTAYSDRLPPVWAVCEVLSLGLLSRWYTNLRPMPTRRAIASRYGLDQRTLQSWLQHLTYVRNVCAHHSRFWNRDLTIIPELPRTKPAGLATQLVPDSRLPYNTLTILLYLMDLISPSHQWRSRLRALVDERPETVAAIGFPLDWIEYPLWKQGDGE